MRGVARVVPDAARYTAGLLLVALGVRVLAAAPRRGEGIRSLVNLYRGNRRKKRKGHPVPRMSFRNVRRSGGEHKHLAEVLEQPTRPLDPLFGLLVELDDPEGRAFGILAHD